MERSMVVHSKLTNQPQLRKPLTKYKWQDGVYNLMKLRSLSLSTRSLSKINKRYTLKRKITLKEISGYQLYMSASKPLRKRRLQTENRISIQRQAWYHKVGRRISTSNSKVNCLSTSKISVINYRLFNK